MRRERFQCLIAVKAAKKNAANTFWLNNIDENGGDKTFTTGISATGNAPATWFLASTVLDKWQLRKVVEVADANSTDVKIAIWAHQKGVKQDLLDKMDGRSYITIADNAQTAQSFLDAFNMKVVKP